MGTKKEGGVTLSVCADCFGWVVYGPQSPRWEYSEGYSGPVEPLLSVLKGVHSVGGPVEPRYSLRPCEGCESGLAGVRAVAVSGWA